MLDYQSLKKRFTEKLKEYDHIRLTQWISFDHEREVIALLGNGEIVENESRRKTIVQLLHCQPKPKSDTNGNTQYAMAA